MLVNAVRHFLAEYSRIMEQARTGRIHPGPQRPRGQTGHASRSGRSARPGA